MCIGISSERILLHQGVPLRQPFLEFLEKQPLQLLPPRITKEMVDLIISIHAQGNPFLGCIIPCDNIDCQEPLLKD